MSFRAANSWHNGTNGFSLRRVSKTRQAIRRIVNRKKDRLLDDEDVKEAVHSTSGAVLPTPKEAEAFVMESAWSERPMAYHPGPRLLSEDEGWNKKHLRVAIFEHCSELKVILNMKLNREKCPDPPPPMSPDERKEHLAKEEAARKEAAAKEKAEQDKKDEEKRKQTEEADRRKAEENKKQAEEQAAEEKKMLEEKQKQLGIPAHD